MPVWIVSAAGDRSFHAKCLKLSERLEKLNRTFHFNNMPGGDHGLPVDSVNWEKALAFVCAGKMLPLLETSEVSDWRKLFDKLLAAKKAGEPCPAMRIWALLDETERDYAKRNRGKTEENNFIKSRLLFAFNRILRREDLYDEKSWAGAGTGKEVAELLRKKREGGLSEEELILLNRRLMENAFPQLLKPYVSQGEK